jgi:hypothetical protein
MPNPGHNARQELRAAALRRLSRLKIAAVTVSTLAFGTMSATLAGQATVTRAVATSAVTSTQAAAETTTTTTAAPAATQAPVTTPIVSAQS